MKLYIYFFTIFLISLLEFFILFEIGLKIFEIPFDKSPNISSKFIYKLKTVNIFETSTSDLFFSNDFFEN